jgi:hypothetical protein
MSLSSDLTGSSRAIGKRLCFQPKGKAGRKEIPCSGYFSLGDNGRDLGKEVYLEGEIHPRSGLGQVATNVLNKSAARSGERVV